MKKANFAQKTLRYAKRELEKYCLAVTGEKPQIELCCETTENTFDDGYLISVKKGIGTITGKNPRSVLLGVYGYFYELGCRFIRPGKDGDLLPRLRELVPRRHLRRSQDGGRRREHHHRLGHGAGAPLCARRARGHRRQEGRREGP